MKKFKKTSPKNKEFILKDEYKEKIANSSHLGKKGYTILKSELSVEDLQFLKNDLHVKPQNFSIKSNSAESSPFSVFRENEKKYIFHAFMVLKDMGCLKRVIFLVEKI